jgi:carbamoylphosphate synthase small subunit
MVDSDAEEFGKCRVQVKDFVALADVDTRHLYTEIRDTARSIRSKELVQLKSATWLHVAVKSKSGSGTLDKVDYVMRVATDGGVAPTEPLGAEGATVKVEYHAIYIFLRK